MTNIKKLLIIFIVLIISFSIVFLFPSVNSKLRVHIFTAKDFLYKPFQYIENKIFNIYEIFSFNNSNILELKKLETRIKNLETLNDQLISKLSDYNELKEVFYSHQELMPKSVGVNIIGNKNHILRHIFIIDKGRNSGISKGDYMLFGKNIIGIVREVNQESSEIVGVLSSDYGDEVIINEKYYIISGTNKSYLKFIRKKDSSEKIDLRVGDKVKIKINGQYFFLGNVSTINGEKIIKPILNKNIYSARVLIVD